MMLLVLNKIALEEIRMKIALIVRCRVGSCRKIFVIILISIIIIFVISISSRNDIFLRVVSIYVE